MRAAIGWTLVISFILVFPAFWFIWQSMPEGMSAEDAWGTALVMTVTFYLGFLLAFSISVLYLKRAFSKVRQGLTKAPTEHGEPKKKRSRVGGAADIALALALIADDDKKKQQKRR